jgi:hypothetical protein
MATRAILAAQDHRGSRLARSVHALSPVESEMPLDCRAQQVVDVIDTTMTAIYG